MKEIANRKIADDALGYNYPTKKVADFTDLVVDTLDDSGNIASMENCSYNFETKTIKPMITNTQRPEYYSDWAIPAYGNIYKDTIITSSNDGFSYTVYLIDAETAEINYKWMDTWGYEMDSGIMTITGIENLKGRVNNACWNSVENHLILFIYDNISRTNVLGKIDLGTNTYSKIMTLTDSGIYSNSYIYFSKEYNRLLIATGNLYRMLIINLTTLSKTWSPQPPQGLNGYIVTHEGNDCYFLDPYENVSKYVKYTFNGSAGVWKVVALKGHEVQMDPGRTLVTKFKNRIVLIHGFSSQYNKAYYFDLNELILKENKDWIMKSPHEYISSSQKIHHIILNDFEEFHTMFFGGFNDGGENIYIHELRFRYDVWEPSIYNPNDPQNQVGHTIETKDLETSEIINFAYSYVTIYSNIYGGIKGVYYSRNGGLTWTGLSKAEELIDISNQSAEQKLRVKIHLTHDAELVHYGLGGMP